MGWSCHGVKTKMEQEKKFRDLMNRYRDLSTKDLTSQQLETCESRSPSVILFTMLLVSGL